MRYKCLMAEAPEILSRTECTTCEQLCRFWRCEQRAPLSCAMLSVLSPAVLQICPSRLYLFVPCLVSGSVSCGRSLLVTAVFAVALCSQAPTASLIGLIRDPTGAVVPAVVRLRLVNNSLGTGHSTVSDGEGYYSFQLLPPNTIEQSDIQLTVQETLRRDFTLPLGATTLV